MLSRLQISLAQLKVRNNAKKNLGNYCTLHADQKNLKTTSRKVWLSLFKEIIFMNSENNKTNESHRFKLNLTDKINLKDPKKIWY